MKMLTDQQIDYHAARVIANDHDWQEHLSVIIAQAKLANELESKFRNAKAEGMEEAAWICEGIAYKNDGFYGFLYAKAIRAAKEPV